MNEVEQTVVVVGHSTRFKESDTLREPKEGDGADLASLTLALSKLCKSVDQYTWRVISSGQPISLKPACVLAGMLNTKAFMLQSCESDEVLKIIRDASLSSSPQLSTGDFIAGCSNYHERMAESGKQKDLSLCYDYYSMKNQSCNDEMTDLIADLIGQLETLPDNIAEALAYTNTYLRVPWQHEGAKVYIPPNIVFVFIDNEKLKGFQGLKLRGKNIKYAKLKLKVKYTLDSAPLKGRQDDSGNARGPAWEKPRQNRKKSHGLTGVKVPLRPRLSESLAPKLTTIETKRIDPLTEESLVKRVAGFYSEAEAASEDRFTMKQPVFELILSVHSAKLASQLASPYVIEVEKFKECLQNLDDQLAQQEAEYAELLSIKARQDAAMHSVKLNIKAKLEFSQQGRRATGYSLDEGAQSSEEHYQALDTKSPQHNLESRVFPESLSSSFEVSPMNPQSPSMSQPANPRANTELQKPSGLSSTSPSAIQQPLQAQSSTEAPQDHLYPLILHNCEESDGEYCLIVENRSKDQISARVFYKHTNSQSKVFEIERMSTILVPVNLDSDQSVVEFCIIDLYGKRISQFLEIELDQSNSEEENEDQDHKSSLEADSHYASLEADSHYAPISSFSSVEISGEYDAKESMIYITVTNISEYVVTGGLFSVEHAEYLTDSVSIEPGSYLNVDLSMPKIFNLLTLKFYSQDVQELGSTQFHST